METNKVTGECAPVRCPDGSRPFVRKPWCRERLLVINNEPSMTQQSHAESVDVNHIINRYDRTGLLPPATRKGFYGDVTGLQGDLTERWQASQEIINTAEQFADGWIPPLNPLQRLQAQMRPTCLHHLRKLMYKQKLA